METISSERASSRSASASRSSSEFLRGVRLADISRGAAYFDGGDSHPREQILDGCRQDDLRQARIGVVARRKHVLAEVLLRRAAAAAAGGEDQDEEHGGDGERPQHGKKSSERLQVP